MIEASRFQIIPLSVQVWALRLSLLFLFFIDEGKPAMAFALSWSPNGLFIIALQRGGLHLPRFLNPVHPIEPVVYRWLGVGLVKRIVATRMWYLLVGIEPPPKPRNHQELLDRIELTTKAAEVCHGATFILVLFVIPYFLAAERLAGAAWIFTFNLLINGYPVMLQRVNRRRVQQIRVSTKGELARERASVRPG